MKDLIFIIYAPMFVKNSAGIYALYKLAKDLNIIGHIAFTTIWGESNFYMPPILDVPILPHIIADDIIKHQNAVVIYPEVVPGNPLNAKNVMRWIMNRPGCFGVGDTQFDPSEKLFMFGKIFLQYLPTTIVVNELTPVLIDTKLFTYDKNIKKTDITVYTGKQEYRNGYVDKYDNLITRTFPSHDAVAAILKKTKILYTFDCLTNVVNEARLCGCEVVYIPNEQQKDDILHNEFGMYGLHSINEVSQLKYDYENIANNILNHINILNMHYKQQLHHMVSLFQNSYIEN